MRFVYYLRYIMDSKKVTRHAKDRDIAKLIFVLGGPGTNRTVHTTRLSQNYGFKRINVDELLRNSIRPVRERY